MTKREAERKRQQRRETVLGCLGLLVVIVLFLCASYLETHYYREATVKSVEKQVVVVEDNCGFVWEFCADGFKKGDKVRMLMDTQCTDSDIEDDIIIDVKLR